MKIVTLQDFFKLPAGTIYSDYDPDAEPSPSINGLFRKAETVHDEDTGEPCDYGLTAILAECSLTPDGSPAMDCGTWGGWYSDDQHFVVYEPADLEVIRKLLFGT